MHELAALAPCRTYLSEIEEHLNEIKAAGGNVLAISSESQKYCDQAKKGWGISFPIKGDPKHTTANLAIQENFIPDLFVEDYRSVAQVYTRTRQRTKKRRETAPPRQRLTKQRQRQRHLVSFRVWVLVILFARMFHSSRTLTLALTQF
jgi:hypothetical protein